MNIIKNFFNTVYNALSSSKKNELLNNDGQYDDMETLTVPDIKDTDCGELEETKDDMIMSTEQSEMLPPLKIDEESRQETCEKEDSSQEQHTTVFHNHTDDLNIDADSLLQNICNAIDYFDDKEKALSAQPGDKVWEFVRTKLIEKLKLSGVSVIKDEETLDWLRHKPIEVIEMPEEGCSIEKTIYPGICLGEKVYLRAVVKLKQK